MRKRAGVICLALALMIMVACSGGGAQRYADEIYNYYSGLLTYVARLLCTLDHGSYITSYTMAHTYSPSEGHLITVLEPEALAGLETRISADGIEITYQGQVFVPPQLDGTSITPVKLLPNMLAAWSLGVPDTAYIETVSDIKHVVQTHYSNIGGEEFMYKTWFDSQTLHPARSEIYFKNKCVLVATYDETETTSEYRR